MTDTLTGRQFWEEIDIARDRMTIAQLSEGCGILLSLLTSTRQRQSFLNFENSLRICRYLSIDMNSFIPCDARENDRLVESVHIDPNDKVGTQFWQILDDVMRYRGWSWRYVALKCNIPTTTISTSKNESRALPFDVSLNLLKGMDLTPDALAKIIHINEGVASCQLEPQKKSDVDIKRDRLIRTIKRLDELALDKVIEYVDFIRSKKE